MIKREALKEHLERDKDTKLVKICKTDGTILTNYITREEAIERFGEYMYSSGYTDGFIDGGFKVTIWINGIIR